MISSLFIPLSFSKVIAVEFERCFNIKPWMGLVKCDNESCGAILGSYEEVKKKCYVHLFNVREALFRPQLEYKYANTAEDDDKRVMVMSLVDGKFETSSFNTLLAKNFILHPARVSPKQRVQHSQTATQECVAKKAKFEMNSAKVVNRDEATSGAADGYAITTTDNHNVSRTSVISLVKEARPENTCVRFPLTSTPEIPQTAAPNITLTMSQEAIPSSSQSATATSTQDVVFNDVMFSPPLLRTNPYQELKPGVPMDAIGEFEEVCKEYAPSYYTDQEENQPDFSLQDLAELLQTP